jgi:hypothetical protein
MATACIFAMAQQSVKISGRVTDFEGKPHHEKGENICYYQSPDFE